jgi:eukaryotic-like serine/threonine-protein kinase
MTLSPGARLGPYEIVAALGAGGMGEVYKARDTRLGRDVAIKVLPSRLAGDPQALARFEREARAVASLSHPNILAIHDFGTDLGVAYAVMELLDGEILRQRLVESPIPWRKAVGIAVQLADGLASAHAKGIVHRDLKPENIFLTTSGLAKILDFGLARVIEPTAAADTPTRGAVTEPGAVMGTVGYMSPEQVRGEEAGPASDIFAFGCVLSEMLTGRGPFARPTPTETMSAILRDDPPRLADHVSDVPREVESILTHCLEKRPEERFQSAGDMAFGLRAASGTTPTRPPAVTSGGLTAALAVLPRWLWWALPVGGLTAVLLGFAIGFAVLPGNTSRVSERYVPLTFRRGTVSNARFAPDGQTVAFSASWDGEPYQVFVKRPESPEPSPTGPPQAHLAAVSRSGELALRMRSEPIAPFMSRGLLASLPLVGGAPRGLREGVVAADWSPDGLGLAVVRDLGDRQRLELPRGTGPYETRGWISDLRYSPRGDLLAFIEHQSREDESGLLVLFDPSRGEKKVLTSGRGPRRDLLGLAWRPDGREVWFGELGALRAVTLDGRERVVTELPESVRVHDIAPDGRVLLAHESRRMQIAARAAGADRERDLSWLTWSLTLANMPDGRTVVFTEFMRRPGFEGIVAMRGTDGSPVVRLGEGLATDLSPDGRWVVAIQGFERSHLVLLPTGAGESRTLPRGPIGNHSMAKFTPDGQRVVFAGREEGRGVRLYLQAITGGEPAPITSEGITLGTIAVSPDGSLAVANWKDGSPWLFPIAGGEPRPLAGGQPGEFAGGWTSDGGGVYLYRMGVEVPLRVVNVRDGTAETRRVLRPSDPAGVMWIGPIIVAADGRSYAYTYFRVLSGLYVAGGLG